jgi:predicted membrane-bound dolichyl-phosphate-mannose-protein mannosyltransferase
LIAVLPFLKKVYRWEYFWLCLVVLATLALHFAIVTNPHDLILDETYYVNEARGFSDNQTVRFQEHPPLGKLFIYAGIEIFGDNPFGWRFFSILLGTGSIVLFYFICRQLNLSRRGASIAVFLLGFENMTFIQSSVAMLDVYYVFFMFGAFLLYLLRRYVAAGVTAGLSVLAKLNAAMGVPVLIIHWFASKVNRSRWFALTVALSIITFVVLLPLLEYIIYQDFSKVPDPFHRIKTMLSLTGGVTFENSTHESMSRPWAWVFNYKVMPYWWVPHYLSAISPPIWALIIPAFAYMLYKAIRRDEAGLFGAAWFASTYLTWIPLSLLTNRLSYVFYFYPTIGAICLGVAMGMDKLIDIFHGNRPRKLRWPLLGLVVLIVLTHLISFMILYPLFPIKLYK